MENTEQMLTPKPQTKKIVIKENIRVPVVKTEGDEEDERNKRNVYSLQRIHASTNYESDYDRLYKDIDKSDYVNELSQDMHKKYETGRDVDRIDVSVQIDLELIDQNNINDNMISYDDEDENEYKDIFSSEDEYFSTSSRNIRESLDLNDAKNMMTKKKFGIRTDQVTGEVILTIHDEKGEAELLAIGQGLVDDITVSVNPKWGKKPEIIVKDDINQIIYPFPNVFEGNENKDFSQIKGSAQAYKFFLTDTDDDDSDPFDLTTHHDSKDDKINEEINGISKVKSDEQYTQTFREAADAFTQATSPENGSKRRKAPHLKVKPVKSPKTRLHKRSVTDGYIKTEKKDSATQTENFIDSNKPVKEENDQDQINTQRDQPAKKSSVLDTLHQLEEEMKPLKNKLSQIQREVWEIDGLYASSTKTNLKPQEAAAASRITTTDSNMNPENDSRRSIVLCKYPTGKCHNKSTLKLPDERQLRAEVPLTKISIPTASEILEKSIPKVRLTRSIHDSRSIWTEPEDDDEDEFTEKNTETKKKN